MRARSDYKEKKDGRRIDLPDWPEISPLSDKKIIRRRKEKAVGDYNHHSKATKTKQN
ncbi:hypothetical protein Bca4012_056320 [Brassica carinata]